MTAWPQNFRLLLWITVYTVVLVWSAISPAESLTWLLEVLPAIIGAAVLAFTYHRFRLSTLVYVLILVHCLILMVGGHYTYAEVPLFDALKPVFGWQRNNYDKLGHFAQGLVPAMIAREVLLRLAVVHGRAWLAFLVLCFSLALSAFYELIEWWVALTGDASAEAFLGTQGYVWDTQSDMAMALLGAIAGLIFLGHLHDRQLAGMAADRAARP